MPRQAYVCQLFHLLNRFLTSSFHLTRNHSGAVWLLLGFIFEDVKIKREHVKGSDDASGNIKPEIEPITEETVRRMENPGLVEVCKSNSTTAEK